MSETLRAYCIRTNQQSILAEWDEGRNLPLTPDTVSYGSRKKVWWSCSEGHSWQARIDSRTNGKHNCPYCSGALAIPGKTDLQTLYPELAAQWHPTKNLPLTPDQITPYSHRKVWWLCPEGHEWQASPGKRVGGSNCPVCARSKLVPGINDLETEYPEIAKEWHPDKNGDLKPSDVFSGSNKKAWWRCSQGHEWQARIASRTGSNRHNCPYCSNSKALPGYNDLKSRYPDIAAEWHPVLNEDLTPEDVTFGSNRKVWWLCPEGHSWEARISSRTGPDKSGCPICHSRKAKRRKQKADNIILFEKPPIDTHQPLFTKEDLP